MNVCLTNLTHPADPGSVWPALESSRGLLSVPACWRARLGEDYEAFRAAFLSRSSQPAKYFPCPRSCGCMHEIIQAPNTRLQAPEKPKIPNSKEVPEAFSSDLERPSPGPETCFLAVCRCSEPQCPDIVLSSDEAVLVELSWAKLSRALCAALNLDAKPLDLGLLNTRQIGSWSAAAVPVILTIQSDHAWFRAVLLELAACLRGRFILLAPTSRHLDAISQELVERAGAGFFALEGNLRLLPGGLLEPERRPGELFARFNPDPSAEPGEDVARQAFALVEQLEGSKPPTPMAVFRLYCMQGLSASRIARQLRCSKPTVLRRLRLIEQRIGVRPEKLRCYSNHLEAVEEAKDDRARRIHSGSVL